MRTARYFVNRPIPLILRRSCGLCFRLPIRPRSICGAAGTARREAFSSLRRRAVCRSPAHASSQLRPHPVRSSLCRASTSALRRAAQALRLFLPCKSARRASPSSTSSTSGDGPTCACEFRATGCQRGFGCGQITRFKQRQPQFSASDRARQARYRQLFRHRNCRDSQLDRIGCPTLQTRQQRQAPRARALARVQVRAP